MVDERLIVVTNNYGDFFVHKLDYDQFKNEEGEIDDYSVIEEHLDISNYDNWAEIAQGEDNAERVILLLHYLLPLLKDVPEALKDELGKYVLLKRLCEEN